MAKPFIKKLSKKGAAIRYQMERGLSNAQISKSLGIPESTIRYYVKITQKNIDMNYEID